MEEQRRRPDDDGPVQPGADSQDDQAGLASAEAGGSELAPGPAAAGDAGSTDEQELKRQLFDRINAAGVRRLGDIATVHGSHDDEDNRPEVASEPPPRIYVASLGDLLVSRRHGAWIDADQDPDSLSDCIDDMLTSSQWSTDQWAIHDVEGFYGLRLGAFETVDRISGLAIGLREHGEALARWVGYLGTAHIDEALNTFEQAYRGHFDALYTYIRHLAETDQFTYYLPAIPVHLLTADLRRIAAQLPESATELYIVESRDGGLHVFDVSNDDERPDQPGGGGS